MSRLALFSVFALAFGMSACAPLLGPPPPSAQAPTAFRAADFGWSTEPGHGSIVGRLAYRQGAVRYSCAHAMVILNPETPWTRLRMQVLYGSDEAAALPTDEVRARTPQAPPGDDSAFLRRTTCDSSNRFSFSGLPDGAWYAITVAKPVGGGKGPGMALMRRVTTHGGRTTTLEL
jgi:hypothetical protein